MTADVVHASIRRWVEETADDEDPAPPEDWTLEHWSVLANEYPDLRFWAAYQPSCPAPVIRALLANAGGAPEVGSDDWRVRVWIAGKRNLPPDLFAVLAADPDEAVRQSIACNAKTPLSIVERLTRDPVENVSRVAAYNLRERAEKLARRLGAPPSRR
jgi:hypothetical protein